MVYFSNFAGVQADPVAHDGSNAQAWMRDRRIPGCWGVWTEAAIQTDRGLMSAGHLQAGDRVRGSDGSLATLLAVIYSEPDQLHSSQSSVLIRRGALGQCLPAEDIILGGGQRLCLTSSIIEALAGEKTALVRASDLVGLPGVSWAAETSDPLVILLFDGPALFSIGGLPLSGFAVDEEAVDGLDDLAKQALFDAFPRARYAGGSAQFELPHMLLDAREAQLVTDHAMKYTRPDTGAISISDIFEVRQVDDGNLKIVAGL